MGAWQGTEVTIPGQFILPDEPRTGIVINVAELRMYYYPEAEELPCSPCRNLSHRHWPRCLQYAVGYHRNHLRQNPVWYPPEPICREAAERGIRRLRSYRLTDNPLGQYAILLDIPGYLIHGTNQPDGIGMRQSRLYSHAPRGY